MIDETEAKTMLCPFANDFDAIVTECVGRACIAWDRSERYIEMLTREQVFGKPVAEEVLGEVYDRPMFVPAEEQQRRMAIYEARVADGWFRPMDEVYIRDLGERAALVRGVIPTGECMKAKALKNSGAPR